MKVFIVDYIGIHCGMHYYNDAMKEILFENGKLEIMTISNYIGCGEKRQRLLNIYTPDKLIGFIKLILDIIYLYLFVIFHKKDCFVFNTFGNLIDVPILYVISKSKKHIIDGHEIIGQNVEKNILLRKLLRKLYQYHIKSAIIHSRRTELLLNEFGFKGKRLYVPHLKYCFKKSCNMETIADDVKNAVKANKINILFFGNINYNKGVDIYIESINLLTEEEASRFNFIIAGKDFDGTVKQIVKKHTICIVLRHINDDELVYLYSKIDYVILPYRKTSQSGVLEMAVYFNKPVLLSNIPYFETLLNKFKSFGILIGNKPGEISKLFKSLEKNQAYYNETDIDKYMNREEITIFKSRFNEWIKE